MFFHLDPAAVGAAVLEIRKVLLLIFYTTYQLHRFSFLLILLMVLCRIYSYLNFSLLAIELLLTDAEEQGSLFSLAFELGVMKPAI